MISVMSPFRDTMREVSVMVVSTSSAPVKVRSLDFVVDVAADVVVASAMVVVVAAASETVVDVVRLTSAASSEEHSPYR